MSQSSSSRERNSNSSHSRSRSSTPTKRKSSKQIKSPASSRSSSSTKSKQSAKSSNNSEVKGSRNSSRSSSKNGTKRVRKLRSRSNSSSSRKSNNSKQSRNQNSSRSSSRSSNNKERKLRSRSNSNSSAKSKNRTKSSSSNGSCSSKASGRSSNQPPRRLTPTQLRRSSSSGSQRSLSEASLGKVKTSGSRTTPVYKQIRRSNSISKSSSLPSEAGSHTKRTDSRLSDYDTPTYGYSTDERESRVNVLSESNSDSNRITKTYKSVESDSGNKQNSNNYGHSKAYRFAESDLEDKENLYRGESLRRYSETKQLGEQQHSLGQQQQSSWSANRVSHIIRTGPVSSAATRSFSASQEPERRRFPRVLSITMPSTRTDDSVRPPSGSTISLNGPVKELNDLNSSLCYGGGIENHYYNAAAVHRARVRSAYSNSGSIWKDVKIKDGGWHGSKQSANDISNIYSRKLARKYRELKEILDLDLTLRAPRPPPPAKLAWVGTGSPLTRTAIEKRRILAWASVNGSLPRHSLSRRRVRSASARRAGGRKSESDWEKVGGDKDDESVKVLSEDSWSVAPSLEILEYDDSLTGTTSKTQKHVTFNGSTEGVKYHKSAARKEETVAQLVERLRRKHEEQELMKLKEEREEERRRKKKEEEARDKIRLTKLDDKLVKKKKRKNKKIRKNSRKRSESKTKNDDGSDKNSSRKDSGDESKKSNKSGSDSESDKGSKHSRKSSASEKSRSRSRSSTASSDSSNSHSRSRSSSNSNSSDGKKKRSKSASPSSSPKNRYSEYYLRPVDADPNHRDDLRKWLRKKNRMLRQKRREQAEVERRERQEQERMEKEREKRRQESREQVQQWLEQKKREDAMKKKEEKEVVQIVERRHSFSEEPSQIRRGRSAPPLTRSLETGIQYQTVKVPTSVRKPTRESTFQSHKHSKDEPVQVKYERVGKTGGDWPSSKRKEVENWLNQSYTTSDNKGVKVNYEVVKARKFPEKKAQRSHSADAGNKRMVTEKPAEKPITDEDDVNLTLWDRLTRGLPTNGIHRSGTNVSQITTEKEQANNNQNNSVEARKRRTSIEQKVPYSLKNVRKEPLQKPAEKFQSKPTDTSKISYKPEYIPKREVINASQKSNDLRSPNRSRSATVKSTTANAYEGFERQISTNARTVNESTKVVNTKPRPASAARQRRKVTTVEYTIPGSSITPKASGQNVPDSPKSPRVFGSPPGSPRKENLFEAVKVQNFDFGMAETNETDQRLGYSRNEEKRISEAEFGRVSPRNGNDLVESSNIKMNAAEKDELFVSGTSDFGQSNYAYNNHQGEQFQRSLPARQDTPEPKMGSPRSPMDKFKQIPMKKVAEVEKNSKEEQDEGLGEDEDPIFGRPKTSRARGRMVMPFSGTGDSFVFESSSPRLANKSSSSWLNNAGFETSAGTTKELEPVKNAPANIKPQSEENDLFSGDIFSKGNSGYNPSFNKFNGKKVGRIAAVKPTQQLPEHQPPANKGPSDANPHLREEDLGFLNAGDSVGLKSIVKRSQPIEEGDLNPDDASNDSQTALDGTLTDSTGAALRRSSKRVTFTEETKTFELKDDPSGTPIAETGLPPAENDTTPADPTPADESSA